MHKPVQFFPNPIHMKHRQESFTPLSSQNQLFAYDVKGGSRLGAKALGASRLFAAKLAISGCPLVSVRLNFKSQGTIGEVSSVQQSTLTYGSIRCTTRRRTFNAPYVSDRETIITRHRLSEMHYRASYKTRLCRKIMRNTT
jgi:hypothetical protein